MSFRDLLRRSNQDIFAAKGKIIRAFKDAHDVRPGIGYPKVLPTLRDALGGKANHLFVAFFIRVACKQIVRVVLLKDGRIPEIRVRETLGKLSAR